MKYKSFLTSLWLIALIPSGCAGSEEISPGLQGSLIDGHYEATYYRANNTVYGTVKIDLTSDGWVGVKVYDSGRNLAYDGTTTCYPGYFTLGPKAATGEQIGFWGTFHQDKTTTWVNCIIDGPFKAEFRANYVPEEP